MQLVSHEPQQYQTGNRRIKIIQWNIEGWNNKDNIKIESIRQINPDIHSNNLNARHGLKIQIDLDGFKWIGKNPKGD